jgi:hypothetical protein
MPWTESEKSIACHATRHTPRSNRYRGGTGSRVANWRSRAATRTIQFPDRCRVGPLNMKKKDHSPLGQVQSITQRETTPHAA